METTLAAKLNSYKNNYWDFTEYRENKALIKYPAMMVAPMQEQLLQNILQCDPTITNILILLLVRVLLLGKDLN